MATTTATKTHCPTCGEKIPRPGMTLCAYCASPLDMSGTAAYEGERSANMERLAKMAEHEDYAAAMAQEPPFGPDLERALDRIQHGTWIAAIGLGAAALPPLIFGGDATGADLWILRPGFFFGLALFLWGARSLGRGLKVKRELGSLTILKRPALVTDRRSETTMEKFTGRTTYYFTLEFEDGLAAEFAWPGRGIGEDPLVQGRTGLAYTRGPELLAFKIIKV